MPHFRYRARTPRGDLLEGRIEASASDTAASQLLHGGITPIEIVEFVPRDSKTRSAGRWLTERKPALADLILLSRQLYTMVKAGVPIIRGIRTLSASTGHPTLAHILRDVGDNLEQGRPLATAMEHHSRIFPPLMINLVRVGEETGRLDSAFERIARYLEFEQDTRDRIRAAMRYPMVVMVAIAVALGVINIFVIPAFAEVFARTGVALPWQTRMLIAVSEFCVHSWPYMLAVGCSLVVAVRLYVGTEAGRYRWDKAKMRLPLIGGLVQRATLARFSRAFSLASRSGVPLVQTLSLVARAVSNEYVGDRILQMRNGVERGESLVAAASGTELFTSLVLEMIAVGEETGAVDDLLEEVADFYEREIDLELKALSSAIEPILIVAIGAMVLVLALGVFLPMWEIGTALKG